jgi:hypothetical protein
VLAVAGGQQRGAGQQLGQLVVLVEDLVEGLEFVQLLPPGLEPGGAVSPAFGVQPGGQRAAETAADILADDAAVDTAGAGVVAAAGAAAAFPGHGGRSEAGQVRKCNTTPVGHMSESGNGYGMGRGPERTASPAGRSRLNRVSQVNYTLVH